MCLCGSTEQLYYKHILLFIVNNSSLAVSGTSSNHSSKCPRVSHAVDDKMEVEKKENPASSYDNDPVVMTAYQDPEAEKENLFIAVIVPGRVEYSAVTFSLGTTGHGSSTAKFTYTSPKIIFDWKTMFETELKNQELLSFHPLVVAVKKEMKNHRESIDSTPQCVINSNLPIQVQTAAETIKKKGKRNLDGITAVYWLVSY